MLLKYSYYDHLLAISINRGNFKKAKANIDILKTYKKDKLISKRNIIMKEIEENTDKEILKKLENELNATIIELAKTK